MQSEMVDVGFLEVETPMGVLLVAANREHVVRIGLPTYATDTVLTELAATLSPRILEGPGWPILDRARAELDAFFAGTLESFTVPVDLQLAQGPFRREVLHELTKVPYGATTSYAELAAAAGRPRAARAAGSACANNPVPIIVPCHRVLAAGGALGGYGGGLEMKRWLLELETR